MHKHPHSNVDPVIFTLSDEAVEAGWERSLYELRHRRQEAGQVQQEQAAMVRQPENRSVEPAVSANITAEPVQQRFGDAELDAAYREYLRRAAAEHNHAADPFGDIGILIEEDFIQAQQSLKSEYSRRRLTAEHTVLMAGNGTLQPLETPSDSNPTEFRLPETVVHVYALPDTPQSRRLQVISEQELLEGIRAKLKPHLSNALAGMVQRAVQKKLATISYDIQMILNEETAKLVDDVLEYNLEAVMRNVKNRLRQD